MTTLLAAETKTRLEVLERKSKIVDRCKPQTDRKLNEMNEKLTMLSRKIDLLEGRFSALVTRATGASPLAVQERVKRLEDSVNRITCQRMVNENSTTFGSQEWLLDRICALEATVDDLQVDMRDNLPDGLNRQFCKDLCSSTISDYSRLERQLEKVVLEADLETRMHLLESKQAVTNKVGWNCPLISVSMLRAKTTGLEEEINGLRGDVGVALSSACNANVAREMKVDLEKWKTEKIDMLRAIGDLKMEARKRDEQIRALVERTEKLLSCEEETQKRQRVSN